MMAADFPYDTDGRGRTAEAQGDAYIHDLIEQVLFTAPGERVNRPDFGCGLRQLVFAPNSDELAAATRAMVQGALQQWLRDLIQVEAVDVQSQEAELQVTVQYLVLRDRRRETQRFVQEVPR